ncbi:MAG: transcriptional regulator [Candidatus Bathyarchaeota archaeon]
MYRLNDKVLGYIILIGSLFGVACYFYLVFLSPWALLVVQVSAFLAVAAMLLIMAWIGYTLATTPNPEPLEDFAEEPSAEEKVEEEA